MSSQVTRESSSSRTEVGDAKFYDKFLETFIKVCGEEEVCKVPQIVFVDKAGVQIAEPETIYRKLSQISTALDKAKSQSVDRKTISKESLPRLPKVSTVDKPGVQTVVPEIALKEGASRSSKTSAVDKKGVQISTPEIVSKGEVHRVSQAASTGKETTSKQDIGVNETGVPLTGSQKEVSRKKKAQLMIVIERPETLIAVAMKSFRIEAALLRTIGRCFLVFPTLSQLRLQNCRLTPEDVYLISVVSRETGTVKQLILEENPLGDMCYSCLLQNNTLQRLSLCNCGVGDLGVVYLAEALEHTGSHSLVRLNLSSNQISCKGAEILANALRTNRTLLSLCLSGNLIENTGAIALAEVFQKFRLRHDEVVERRGRYLTQNLKQLSCVSFFEDTYPFLTEAERENGALYCKGNFTLLHLNLSYNSIGLPGMLAFHQAVLYQESVPQPADKGLLSVGLQGNSFPEHRPELEEMVRIFDARLELHRRSSKIGSLESSRSTSKTRGLGSVKSGSKSRDVEKGSSKMSDSASVKQ